MDYPKEEQELLGFTVSGIRSIFSPRSNGRNTAQ